MSNFKKYTAAKTGNKRRERGSSSFAKKPKTFVKRTTFRKDSFVKNDISKPTQSFETFTNSPRREFKKRTETNLKTDSFVFGKNVIFEAVLNRPGIIEKIIIAKEKFTDERTLNILNNQKTSRNNGKIIEVEYIDEESFPRVIKSQNHQGIFAKINLYNLTINFKNFLEDLQINNKINNKTCLIILGELTDVENVGSIIRSASAFGVSGILIPENNQAQINETIIKISAGQAFNIPLVKIGNINDTIAKLKENKFWIYGLDMEATKFVQEENFTEPTVFVIGSEGEGLRKSFKDNCDITLKIPMSEKCESLNASISTAVAMYEWRKQNI